MIILASDVIYYINDNLNWGVLNHLGFALNNDIPYNYPVYFGGVLWVEVLSQTVPLFYFGWLLFKHKENQFLDSANWLGLGYMALLLLRLGYRFFYENNFDTELIFYYNSDINLPHISARCRY